MPPERLHLLCVYAHPDDESFGPAAVLAKYAGQGAVIHGLYFTRGQNGQASVQPPPPPEELGRLREQDLRDACAAIGFAGIEILDYADGTLEQVPTADLEAHVLKALRRHQPEVVFTFGPGGITRHPDHLAVHTATVRAFEQARAEGLPVRELYYDAVAPEQAAELAVQDEPDGNPNTWVDVADSYAAKLEALRLHARHVLDAQQMLDTLATQPRTVATLHRAWPSVPAGAVVRGLLESTPAPQT